MFRFFLICLFVSPVSLSAQTHPWSASFEVGWNSGRDLGYALRLNHTIPAGRNYEVVCSALLERGVVTADMMGGDAFAFPNSITEAFLPGITSIEFRSGAGVGLHRRFGNFILGGSVRAVWRVNERLLLELPNQLSADGLPRTTSSIRYGEQVDRSREIQDDLDLIVSGDRLRLQAGLEAGVQVSPSLELSLLYRYDAFGRNEQRITGIGGFRPDRDTPLNLFRGVSRGHYLMAGLTVAL